MTTKNLYQINACFRYLDKYKLAACTLLIRPLWVGRRANFSFDVHTCICFHESTSPPQLPRPMQPLPEAPASQFQEERMDSGGEARE